MSSILTNITAMSALETLRTIGSNMNETQNRVSSGMRIANASDNAAYWSISTTMRSDNKAISAVMDALSFGAASVDVAYSAMESVVDILGDFKAKLIAAKEDGVDKSKIQGELSQLQDQVINIAQSASFNGVNWLLTDIMDLRDPAMNRTYVSSAFHRDDTGVSVSKTAVDLSTIALFNTTGSGILQADDRSVGFIGGIKRDVTTINLDGSVDFFRDNTFNGRVGSHVFDFQGPITFGAADSISFDITVDEDDPSYLPPPHSTGKTTSIMIDRAMVDQVLPGAAGIIQTHGDYINVLNHALSTSGSDAAAAHTVVTNAGGTTIHPSNIYIGSTETSGLDGSSVRITNLQATVPTSGLDNIPTNFGTRGAANNLYFAPYEVPVDGNNPDGVTVTFDFVVDGVTKGPYSFDRTYVNNVLGVMNGQVNTAAEQAILLQSLLAADWPDIIITSNAYNDIVLTPDYTVNRLSGARTSFGFSNVNVSNEPISGQNFRDINIVTHPQHLDRDITYLETVTSRVISAASSLGALQMRIDMQSSFASTLMDSISSGIGRLVDANMDEESTRLKAVQTQQQLAVQSLSIANSNAQNIVTLFQ
jgi:flagellin